MLAFLANARSLGAREQSAEFQQRAKKAEAAIARNDVLVAKQELEAMLKIDPTNASLYANLGMIEFSQQRYPEASRHFEKALAHDPSLWSASAFLGMSKVRLGATAQGQNLLEESLAHIADRTLHVQAGLELVRTYSEAGMVEKAEAILNKLAEFDQGNSEVLYSVYRLHLDMSSAALRKLTVTDPNSAWVHEVLGQNFMAQEQYSAAIQEFRTAILRGPNLTGLRYQLGEALLAESRTEENRALAEKEFLAELQRNSRHSESLLKLADIDVERSQFDEAKALVTRALAVRAESAEAHALLGKILDAQEDVKAAIAELETAEKLAPEARMTHYQLAQLYRKQGRTAESDREIAAFRQLAATDAVPQTRAVYSRQTSPHE